MKPALLLLLAIGFAGCATRQSGVISNTSTVLGVEIAYVTGDSMPSVKVGLIRNEYVRTGTNTYEVLKTTQVDNKGIFNTKMKTSTAIGSIAVTQDSAAKDMPEMQNTVAPPSNVTTPAGVSTNK